MTRPTRFGEQVLPLHSVQRLCIRTYKCTREARGTFDEVPCLSVCLCSLASHCVGMWCPISQTRLLIFGLAAKGQRFPSPHALLWANSKSFASGYTLAKEETLRFLDTFKKPVTQLPSENREAYVRTAFTALNTKVCVTCSVVKCIGHGHEGKNHSQRIHRGKELKRAAVSICMALGTKAQLNQS